MKQRKSFQKKSEKLTGLEREGVITTLFGAMTEVEDETGETHRCHIRKNLEPITAGDRVLWLPENGGTGVIVGYLPRKSLLYRMENKHKQKLIAANIDAIIIATAPPPLLSEDMIDRYLVASETLNIPAAILLNKVDLLDEPAQKAMKERLSIYEKLGYPVIFSSTVAKDGLLELNRYLQNKICVLVGASGVGKSSAISALTQIPSIKIGETSTAGLGKHTTTSVKLYHLPLSGSLIDSPGVREFGLWRVTDAELLQGFIDFQPYLNQCKFRNCKHQSEPDCAIISAVEENEICKRRFESFKKISAELNR